MYNKTPFRYDHVGSFLRPEYLKEARKQYEQGEITKEQLTEVEDKAITELVVKEKDNISKELLDEGLDLREPEEILYFSRADKIKDLLMHQFENADEALIYEYTEQIYQNIYE